MLTEILDGVYYGNRVADYLVFLALLAGGILLVKLLKTFVARRLRERAAATPTRMDDFLLDRIGKTGVPLACLAVVESSLRTLKLPSRVERIIDIAGIVLMAVLFTLFAVALVRFGLQEYVRKQGGDSSRERVLKGISSLATALVWSIGVLFMLDNLGFRISTVVAGLGIGGIAVALAAQAVLGDFFAYFTILFDRPFEIGDYIVVGDHQGTIERFGIKTTRIAGPGGEQIIIANKDLTDSRVRNFGRMTRRRVAFQFLVVYQTETEALRAIPGMVEAIFRGIEGAALDRVHFHSYGNIGMTFEVVYSVEGGDFNRYMDIQQEVNLRILEELRGRGIELAYVGQPPPPPRAGKGA